MMSIPVTRNLTSDMSRDVPSDIVNLYHEAFDKYEHQCFWSTRRIDVPKFSDVLDATNRLKRDGDMAARRLAVEIEKVIHAAL